MRTFERRTMYTKLDELDVKLEDLDRRLRELWERLLEDEGAEEEAGGE